MQRHAASGRCKICFCFIPQSAQAAKCGWSMTTGDCSFAAVARNLADRRCVNITKILMTFTSTSDLRELRSLTIEGWRLISTTIRNKVCIQFMHWYDACLPECEILPTTAPIYVMIHILHECKTVKYHYIYYMQKKPNYLETKLLWKEPAWPIQIAKKKNLPMTVIVIIEVIMCLYLWNFAD